MQQEQSAAGPLLWGPVNCVRTPVCMLHTVDKGPLVGNISRNWLLPAINLLCMCVWAGGRGSEQVGLVHGWLLLLSERAILNVCFKSLRCVHAQGYWHTGRHRCCEEGTYVCGLDHPFHTPLTSHTPFPYITLQFSLPVSMGVFSYNLLLCD